MIFLSHNYKDKPIVENIAVKLAEVFGKDKVFYDAWSIVPGEGIIDKMDKGLSEAEFFFYFVSENSITSKMVTMEWQNALLAETSGKMQFIPVRVSNVEMPVIIAQKLYIDLYTHGLENSTRQIFDVINKVDSFKPQFQDFSNWKAYINEIEENLHIRIAAENFMEPISHFLFVVNHGENEIGIKCTNTSMTQGGFNKDYITMNGVKFNAYNINTLRPTTPEFPSEFILSKLKDVKISLVEILYEKKPNEWHKVPSTNDKNFRIKSR